MQPRIAIWNTDVEPSILEHWLWDFRLADSEEDIAKATDLPISYIRQRLNELRRDPVEFDVSHPYLAGFRIIMDDPGMHAGCLWGLAEASGMTLEQVKARYEHFKLVEDDAIVAIAEPDLYDHLAMLRLTPDGVVQVIIAWLESDAAEPLDTDKTLKLLVKHPFTVQST